MEQFDLMEIEAEVDELCCLSDLPIAQVQDDTQVFKLVVETTNYRVEIEIG